MRTAARSANELAQQRGLNQQFRSDSLTKPNSEATLHDIEQYIHSLRHSINGLRDKLNQAIITHEASFLLAVLNSKGAIKTTSAAEALASRLSGAGSSGIVQATAPAELDVDQRRIRVLATLERLTSDVNESERLAIKSLASDLALTAEKSRFDGLELEIRRRIQHANEAARRARAQADHAARLLVQLRGLQGPEVDAMVTELKAVERRERSMAPDLDHRIEAAVQEARERADQEYVAEVVSEELARLGYEVDAGFATLFVSGGVIHLNKPQHKEYGVRLQASPETSHLEISVVREGFAGEPLTNERKIRDREMEELWCADFARVLTIMGKRGVSGRVVKRVRPGSQPVAIVEPKRSLKRATREQPLTAKRQT